MPIVFAFFTVNFYDSIKAQFSITSPFKLLDLVTGDSLPFCTSAAFPRRIFHERVAAFSKRVKYHHLRRAQLPEKLAVRISSTGSNPLGPDACIQIAPFARTTCLFTRPPTAINSSQKSDWKNNGSQEALLPFRARIFQHWPTPLGYYANGARCCFCCWRWAGWKLMLCSWCA